MSDDLVKRVRRIGIGSELGATTRDRTTAQEAADRIESLEAALRNARARYVELDDREAAEAMAKIISEALGDDCD